MLSIPTFSHFLGRWCSVIFHPGETRGGVLAGFLSRANFQQPNSSTHTSSRGGTLQGRAGGQEGKGEKQQKCVEKHQVWSGTRLNKRAGTAEQPAKHLQGIFCGERSRTLIKLESDFI